MGFIDDNEFGALLQEHVASDVRLNEIDADDLERVVVVDAGIALDLAVKPGLSIGTDDDRLDVELRSDLLLPLFAEVGEADDRKAFDLPAFQKLADDEKSFDGLADTNIIGDQKPHGVLTQRHDERHDLVSPRPEREFGKGSERAGAIAEGKPGRIVKKPGGADIAEVGARWWGEASVDRAVGVNIERQVDAGDFLVGAAERLDDQRFSGSSEVGQPIRARAGKPACRAAGAGHRTFLKMSGRWAIFAARSSR